MAPKKKSNRKADDDWESEALADASDPTAAATQEAQAGDAAPGEDLDDTGSGGGGLLAALKKNKQNKKKKGKVVDDDPIDGKDDGATDKGEGKEPDSVEMTSKGPEEATADDLFDSTVAKGKGTKAKFGKKDAMPQSSGAESDGDTGGMKSKKEKEKERKEREKQRKKEQVPFR